MKQYNLVIDERLIAEVDRLIEEHGLYHSRSDFIRDAIRSRLLELKRLLSEAPREEEEEGAESHALAEPEATLLGVFDEHKYGGVH